MISGFRYRGYPIKTSLAGVVAYACKYFRGQGRDRRVALGVKVRKRYELKSEVRQYLLEQYLLEDHPGALPAWLLSQKLQRGRRDSTEFSG